MYSTARSTEIQSSLKFMPDELGIHTALKRQVAHQVHRVIGAESMAWFALLMGNTITLWWITTTSAGKDLATYASVLACIALVSIPLLSPVSDRFSRRNLLTAGVLLCAINALGVVFIVFSGQFSLALVILVNALAVVGQSIWIPASSNLMAEIIEPENLSSAIALQKRAQYFGKLTGPAVAGLLLILVPIAYALIVPALIMVLAFLLSASAAGPVISIHPREKTCWFREIRNGMFACWQVPTERWAIIVNFCCFICFIPCTTMLLPLMAKSMHIEPVWLGAWEAAISVGMLIGTFTSRIWITLLGRYPARIVFGTLEGLALGFVGFAWSPMAMTIAFALAGYANSTVILVGYTHRLLARPEAFRGRMTTAAMATIQISAMIGPLLAAKALDVLPAQSVVSIFGLSGSIFALLFVAVPGMKALLSTTHDQACGWYKRQYPVAFKN